MFLSQNEQILIDWSEGTRSNSCKSRLKKSYPRVSYICSFPTILGIMTSGKPNHPHGSRVLGFMRTCDDPIIL